MIKKIFSLLLVAVMLLPTLVGCTPSLDRLEEKFKEEGYAVKYSVNYNEIEKVYDEAGESFEKSAIYRVLFVQDPEDSLRWLKIVEFYRRDDADRFYRLYEYEYSRPQAGTTIKQKGKVIFYGTPSVYAVVD